MGSIPGAYVAALLIAELKAVCVWLEVVEILGIEVSFSQLTLVVDFLVMAAVLVWRPWGLMGRPQAVVRQAAAASAAPLRLAGGAPAVAAAALLGLALAAVPFFTADSPYTLVLGIDLLVAALFATSLHFLMGPAGMHSFGHAAYFGLGAYGAALLARASGISMEAALVAAPLVFGWFAVRLSGVYMAMLTLAFAQITWAVTYQWDAFTGGSNGLTGVWPSPWLADRRAYYWLALALTALGVWWLRRVLFSPFGYALRASRDSVLRADAIGIDVKRMQWAAFVIAGTVAGPAGAIVGAVTFTWLHDTVARNTEYWRAMLGGIILLLVLLFPSGIAGAARQLLERFEELRARLFTATAAPAGATIVPGERAALIVVDVQNCFVDGGTLSVKGGAEVVPVINRLAGAFANIVVTQDWHTAGRASFASAHAGTKPFETTRLSYGTQVPWPDHCVQGTDDAALHKDLALPTAQVIVRKGFHKDVDSYSAFEEADRKTATGLGGYLKQRGIKTVFVTGLATDFCVAWTALDARKAGFEAYVVEDATRAIDLNGSLATACKQMAARGVKRIRSADIALA